MTTKQRAILRGMASTYEPILHIGKDGIDENVVKQCDDALEARELIKAAVLETAPYTAREACEIMCEETGAEPVQVIGRRFVIYRQAKKNSKIVLSELR